MICIDRLKGIDDYDISSLRFAFPDVEKERTYEIYIHLDFRELVRERVLIQSGEFDVNLVGNFLDTLKSFPDMVIKHLQYFTLFYELKDEKGTHFSGSQKILNRWQEEYFGDYVKFSYGEESKHLNYTSYWNAFLDAARTTYSVENINLSHHSNSAEIDGNYIQMITWNEFIYFLKTCDDSSYERDQMLADKTKYAEYYIALADLEEDRHEDDPDQTMRILSSGQFNTQRCLETIQHFRNLSFPSNFFLINTFIK